MIAQVFMLAIARELFSLTKVLAAVKRSTADSSLDVRDTCVEAYLAIRR